MRLQIVQRTFPELSWRKVSSGFRFFKEPPKPGLSLTAGPQPHTKRPRSTLRAQEDIEDGLDQRIPRLHRVSPGDPVAGFPAVSTVMMLIAGRVPALRLPQIPRLMPSFLGSTGG